MVHNRAIGFPCNFGRWRQQQIAFSKLRHVIFLSEKFQVASHNTEEWGWVYHQLSTRWTSRENLTHFIWHRVHGRNSELCLSFFGYSLHINLLSCASISAQTWIFRALQPADWRHRPVRTLESFCCAKNLQGEGFQTRLQFPPLVLSCQQPYQPIWGSNILCLI